MYWVLNYLPTILKICMYIYPFELNFDPLLYFSVLLFVMPLYLLVVNGNYVIRGKISIFKSIAHMLNVIIINVIMMIVSHKVYYGTFIGDVPEDLYCLLVGVPGSIVIAGIIIYYIINRNR